MSPQPPPEAPSDPLVGLELNGYQIRSVMAEGGMGKVYLAVHPMVGAKAAIKVMLPQFADDKEQVERFVREARVLASLNHDRIVKIMGFGTLADGRQYMITEHLEGALLSRLIEREAPMNPARMLNLLDQMLDALAAAHAAGVVHRDLKPANVIVKAVGTERKLKLLDFGLARARVIAANADPSMPLNKASQVMGTPEYMAPEQARGFAPTPASDLYSVGVMAFEMLTHRLPFLANNVFEMMKHHVNTTPPKVGVLVPSLPPALEDLVAQLLSKTPEERGAPAERTRKVVQQILRDLPEPENPARKGTTGEWRVPSGILPAPNLSAVPSSKMKAVPNASPSGPTPHADTSRRASNPAAPVATGGGAAMGSPHVTPAPFPVQRVDPAYAAAREKAQPQVEKRSSPVKAFAYLLGLGVVWMGGMAYERYNATKHEPVPFVPLVAPPQVTQLPQPATHPDAPVVAGANEQTTPDAGAEAAAEHRVPEATEAATPEVRDPKELCRDLRNWRSELLDNVKTMRRLYVTAHPDAKTEKPPLKGLGALRDLGVAADSSAICEKVQKGLDEWEMHNLKHN